MTSLSDAIPLPDGTIITPEEAVLLIKKKAVDLGFEACGIAEAAPVSEDAATELRQWLDAGWAAEMSYLQQHKDLRLDPRLLFPGARSLIVTAMNYFPAVKQESDLRFAYYAYGADYHYVVRRYLNLLLEYMRTDLLPRLAPGFSLEGRPFSDSAPLLEHYWAVRSGIGFLGRNRLLILPRHGSYYFIGTLIVNLPLPADRPLNISCGTCRRCLEACPTQALRPAATGFRVDARRCISYQTIENRREEIPQEIARRMSDRVYGCDACQQACPWNRFATPTRIPEFQPSSEFLALDRKGLRAMGNSGFKRLFRHSAVMRAGYKGLLRNLHYMSGETDERSGQ